VGRLRPDRAGWASAGTLGDEQVDIHFLSLAEAPGETLPDL
jgi:hypothetical protein